MAEFVCGVCGGRMSCQACADAVDIVQAARRVIRDVLLGKIDRNSHTRVRAAELVLTDKGLLQGHSDEDLLAEVKRRTGK